MSNVWNQEFLNSNSQRNYPLFEEATATDTSGDFVLPQDFILGLNFPVHAGLDIDPYKIFLRRVVVFGVGVNVSLGYDDGTAAPPILATAIIPKNTHDEYDMYPLIGVNDFADSVGRIVIGKLSSLDSYAGSFLFTPEAGKLEPDCIQPMIRGLSGLRVRNGTDVSELITGDIELSAGTNCSLVVSSITGGTQIQINAIEGAGLSKECGCNTDDVTLSPIYSINGIYPDGSGNINLLGSDCVEITTADNTITLKNTCSPPCCGCDELTALTTRLMELGAGATTLTSTVNALAAVVNQMNMVVLGSRLRDSGCVTCN